MDDDFTAFWQAYPRRQGTGDARRALTKALRKVSLAVILEALAWQVTHPDYLKRERRFIPYPATWLNQERYLDPKPTPEPSRPAIAPETLAHLERVTTQRLAHFEADRERIEADWKARLRGWR